MALHGISQNAKQAHQRRIDTLQKKISVLSGNNECGRNDRSIASLRELVGDLQRKLCQPTLSDNDIANYLRNRC